MSTRRYGRRGNGKGAKGWPKKPGALVYGGSAVHEVLADGHTLREREDLVPGSPARLWKPKFAKSFRHPRRKDHPANKRKSKKWIQKIHLKKGALHRHYRIPLHKKIPIALLKRDASAPGKLGYRARFALTRQGYRKQAGRWVRRAK